ncbi:hypothetical protein KRP22_015208 [Phytophthora ramorum]|nr:hypothetical protein KRP22_15140 [Phytophthora ramorum]
MNDDEFKELEDVLTFFDECDDTITGFASDHNSDESSSSVHNVQSCHEKNVADVALKSNHRGNRLRGQVNNDTQEIAQLKSKLAVPGRNRSRDLQKLELLQLRVEAAGLQGQVDELSSPKENTTRINMFDSLARRGDDKLLDAWKSMTKKQKTLRLRAEVENENLRNLHTTQLKSIKTLKHLLQKHEATKRSACISRNFYVNSFFETEREAVTVLDKLSDSLGKMFTETDRTFRLNGLNTITSAFSKVDTQSISATTTHIELLKCCLMPFDFRDVSKTFYGKMTAGCGLDEVESVNTLETQMQNVVARAFTVEIEERVKIQYRYAGIRYSEHKREVIVLSGQNQMVEAFGIALDGVGFHEKEVKYVVPGRQHFVEQLCEMLAHLKEEVFDSVQRNVEHDLLVA